MADDLGADIGSDIGSDIASGGSNNVLNTAPTLIGVLNLVALTCVGQNNVAFSWNAGDTQPPIEFTIFDVGAGQNINGGTNAICTVNFVVPGQSSFFDSLTATSADGLTWTANRGPNDLITTTPGRFYVLVRFAYVDGTGFSVPDSGNPSIVIVNSGWS
jgi:hypothetical protein